MTARFCPDCDNIQTPTIERGGDAAALVFVCGVCGARQHPPPGAVAVSETSYGSVTAGHSHLHDPSMADDPSLPRVLAVCPNAECPASTPPGGQAVYIRYDYDSMSFLYCCTACRAFWDRTYS
jgi:hypothetical protein